MRTVSPAALLLLLGVALLGCSSSRDRDSNNDTPLEVKLPMTGANQVVLAVPEMT
jgi:hypothetical protein